VLFFSVMAAPDSRIVRIGGRRGGAEGMGDTLKSLYFFRGPLGTWLTLKRERGPRRCCTHLPYSPTAPSIKIIPLGERRDPKRKLHLGGTGGPREGKGKGSRGAKELIGSLSQERRREMNHRQGEKPKCGSRVLRGVTSIFFLSVIS